MDSDKLHNLPSPELWEAAQAEGAQFELPEDWRQDRTVREDLFAVDPEFSLDSDDVIGLTKHNETKTLHVGITDVGSFLAHSIAICKNARRRTETKYRGNFAVRPMIPKQVSEDKLSLLPNQERPILTVSIPLNERCEAGEAIITRDIVSANRRSYQEIDAQLASPDESPHTKILQDLDVVAKQLYINRHAGSDSIEPALETEEGQIEEYADVSSSQLIVQESMILAGIVMSKFMEAQGVPALYRNHVVPTDLLAQTTDFAERRRLSYGVRAEYGIQPLGHVGLRTATYMHFTSPLRRFADFANHLNLVAFLEFRPLPYPEDRLQRITDRINRIRLERVEWERGRFQALRQKRAEVRREQGIVNAPPHRQAKRLISRFETSEAQPSDIDIALFDAAGTEDQLLTVKEKAARFAAANIYEAIQAIHIAVDRGHLILRPKKSHEFDETVHVVLEDASGNTYPYHTDASPLDRALTAVQVIGRISGLELEPIIPYDQTPEGKILKNGMKYLESLAEQRCITMVVKRSQVADGQMYFGVLVNPGNGPRLFEATASSKEEARRQATAAAIQELDLINNPPPIRPAKYKAYKRERDNPLVQLTQRQQKQHAEPPRYTHEPDESITGAFTCTLEVSGAEGNIMHPPATGRGIGKKAASQQAAAAMLEYLQNLESSKKETPNS